ncbi:MAG: type IV pili methyl-accepting chemotaxis transducer N-terminal domain-containing protein [Dechloromonas sp.]|nr:type IV pili methyl-accepting chemotaxis transducer N-terminal domain-containing protein [Dechloromonas sp.]
MNTRNYDPHRAQRKLLSGSQLFIGLQPGLLDDLIAASRVLELSANQTLYKTGEPIREAHLLFSGSVKRSTIIPGGATKVIELVQNEQLLSVGELFGATHYVSSCCGITQTLLVAIDIRRLREATQNNLEFSCRIISALARRQVDTEFDVTSHHYGLTGTQRLLDYLLEMAGERAGLAGETTVVLKASKKVIAARIGMTPESLSRNLRELSDNGVIVVDGRKVHIQNAALLDTVSGGNKQRLNFCRKPKGNALNVAPTLSAGALVNMCGRLRVLSQRMAIAWGMIAFAIAPHNALIKFHRLEKEFERNLARLDKLELAADLTERLTLIKALWPRYQELMGGDEPSTQLLEEVFELSEELLEATDRLTGRAASLAGLREAHYVNMAGRNRMLSQRISKFFLFNECANLDERIAALTPSSYLEFESNLQALGKTGNIPPELSAQLQVVGGRWQKFIRAMCPDLSHSARNQHTRLVMAEGDRLLRSVDTTVKLFERLTK